MRHYLFPILVAAFCMMGCGEETASPMENYTAELRRGHDVATSQNEIFFGLKLGMTDRQFYDRCTELNSQKIITMGGGGNRVDHLLPEELERPGKMVFVPVFFGDRPRIIQAMNLIFTYEDWSPWNRAAKSDKLLPDVAAFLGEKIGGALDPIQFPNNKLVYVRIDGNRHTAVWIEDDSQVYGRVTDLAATDEDPLKLFR